MKLNFLFIALIITYINLYSEKTRFNLIGYVDTYYCTDDVDREFDIFSSINHRRETFALNIVYLKFAYNDEQCRVKFALQEGDIPKNIYYQNPRNIQQANVEYKIFDKLWIGAGIFPTHIGWETTHPRNNFLSSHSATTFFEPTYQTGAMLNYKIDDNFSGSIYLINGNHLFEDNNKNKSLGFALNFSNENVTLSYNNIIGNEEPTGKPTRLHTYHNLIFHLKMNPTLDFAAQIDIATLEKSFENNSGTVKSGFLQYRYKFSENFNQSARFSYFSDVQNVYNLNVEGFDITIGAEYKPAQNSYIRIENRYLKINNGSNKFAFIKNKRPNNEFLEFSINFGAWFDFSF